MESKVLMRPWPIDQGSHASLRIVFNLADLSVAWLKRQQSYRSVFRNPTNQLRHVKESLLCQRMDRWKLQAAVQTTGHPPFGSEVIQHIQQIFVGVVFLGPSKKDSKKEPRFDQDLNIWCDYRGQPWSNFIPWISWRARVSFVVFFF